MADAVRLTQEQRVLLGALNDKPGATARELAKILRVSDYFSSGYDLMHARLKRLEGRGLVARAKRSGQETTWALTKDGIRYVASRSPGDGPFEGG